MRCASDAADPDPGAEYPGCATATVPRFVELTDQHGTTVGGRRSNLVLLDANPLDSLSTLRRPRAVIAGGPFLDRAALGPMEKGLLAAGE